VKGFEASPIGAIVDENADSLRATCGWRGFNRKTRIEETPRNRAVRARALK
jgi:hypothetical protein